MAIETVEKVEKETPEQKEEKAREEDKKKAEEEQKASDEKMKNLKEPFVSVRRYRGIGPLVLVTRRGDIKAFSGDIIAKVAEPELEKEKGKEKEKEDEDEKKARLLKAEEIVFTEGQFLGLSGLDAKGLPDTLENRALRIGEERRAKEAKEKDKEDKDKDKEKDKEPKHQLTK